MEPTKLSNGLRLGVVVDLTTEYDAIISLDQSTLTSFDQRPGFRRYTRYDQVVCDLRRGPVDARDADCAPAETVDASLGGRPGVARRRGAAHWQLCARQALGGYGKGDDGPEDGTGASAR